MKYNLKKIFGIICYILSLCLVIYYFILEFSVLNVTSPINRLKILFLIILIMYFGSKFINNKKLYKLNFYIWFLLYIVMLLNLTLFDKYFGREGVSLYLIDLDYIKNYFEYSFNIIPFSTIDNYLLALRNGNLALGDFIYNIFGNILAFCPFALFLPRIFKKTEKWYYYFLVVSLVILFIEIMQLLMLTGSFDIDDYILNIVGSMVLYFILNIKFIKRFLDKILCLDN